jgi:hypothetical protein
MRAMLPRHRLPQLARLVLAGFVLVLAAAALSPLLQPRALQLVCGAQGPVLLVVDTGDGRVGAPGHTLDCALCLPLGAPSGGVIDPAPPVAAVARPHWVRLDALRVARARAPLPPRGPPVLS